METRISKSTARDIHRVRQALEAIAVIENDAPKSHENARNVAHLQWNDETLAIRSDILAKWTNLCDNDESILSVDAKGDILLLNGQARVKLCAINVGEVPPFYPIKVSVNGTIDLAFDPQPILDKAKSLNKNKAAAKAARKIRERELALQARRESYEKALRLVDALSVAREVKKLRRLRRLTQWLRHVKRLSENPPKHYEVIEHPLLQMFDPAYVNDYAYHFEKWSEAKRRHDNFKPRSWRSNGLEKHTKAMNIAKSDLDRTLNDAIRAHVQSFGFEVYNFGIYYSSPVSDARKVVRQYERELASGISD